MATNLLTQSFAPSNCNSMQSAVAAEQTAEQRLRLALRDRHYSMLWLSAVVLVLSFGLSIRESHVACASFDLPILCGSRALFGVACPGCGLTRSFVALADGNVEQSLEFHRLGWLIFLTVVCQIPYRWYRLRELRSKVVSPSWPGYLGYLLVASLVGSWAWNLWP